jgi:hypothetical protein
LIKGSVSRSAADEIEAETPLDAQAAVIGGFALDAGDLDHPVVPNMQVQLAAHAAVAAGGAHFLVSQGRTW